jgi:hypothetical protein
MQENRNKSNKFIPNSYIKYEENNRIKIATQEKIINGNSMGKYLYMENDNMYRFVKKILLILIRKNIPISDDNYKKYFDIVKKCIEIFYGLYIQNTQIDEVALYQTIQKLDKVGDLYNILKLGGMNIFHVSNKHISDIAELTEELSQCLSTLESDNKDLPD